MCACVCVHAPTWFDLALQTPSWSRAFSVTVSPASGPSIPVSSWNACWDIQLEIQAPGPAIRQDVAQLPFTMLGYAESKEWVLQEYSRPSLFVDGT